MALPFYYHRRVTGSLKVIIRRRSVSSVEDWMVDRFGNSHDLRNRRIVTRLTRAFECLHPIVLPPIGPAAGPRLVAAVVESGGIGFLGSGLQSQSEHGWSADEHISVGNLAGKLFQLKQLLLDENLQDRIGIGLMTTTLRNDPSYFDQVLSMMPRNLWITGDNFEPYLRVIHSQNHRYASYNNPRVFVQVSNTEAAGRAQSMGADLVVVQNSQARIPLAQSVLRSPNTSRIPTRIYSNDVKVSELDALLCSTRHLFDRETLQGHEHVTLLLGAGGIYRGQQIESAIRSGSDGVAIGLRFAATVESALDEKQKLTILRAYDPTADSVVIPSVKEVMDNLISDLLATASNSS